MRRDPVRDIDRRFRNRAITGWSSDANYVHHGYVRTSDGLVTMFDAPGAGTGPGQGTFSVRNNSAGTVAGYYADAHDVYHGFVVRQPTD